MTDRSSRRRYAQGVPMLYPDPDLLGNCEGDWTALERARKLAWADLARWMFATDACQSGDHLGCRDTDGSCTCPHHTAGLCEVSGATPNGA